MIPILQSSQAQPVVEIKYNCEHCDNGIQRMDKHEFYEWLKDQDWDTRINKLRAIIEFWKDNGGIICPVCDGRGVFIERR